MRLLRAVGTLTLVGVSATIASTAALVSVTTRTTTTIVTVAATAATFTIATAALASAPRGFGLDDGLEGLVVGQQLDESKTFLLVATSDDRQDFHPIEHLLGLDLHHVADRGIIVKDRTVHGAFRLEGSGCAPCPRTFRAYAC
jgi:hypothetical protein